MLGGASWRATSGQLTHAVEAKIRVGPLSTLYPGNLIHGSHLAQGQVRQSWIPKKVDTAEVVRQHIHDTHSC